MRTRTTKQEGTNLWGGCCQAVGRSIDEANYPKRQQIYYIYIHVSTVDYSFSNKRLFHEAVNEHNVLLVCVFGIDVVYFFSVAIFCWCHLLPRVSMIRSLSSLPLSVLLVAFFV